MSIVTAAHPSLKIVFGAASAEGFDLGVPVLAGTAVENIFGPALRAGRAGAFELFQAGEWLLGVATVPLAAGLEAATQATYADLFRAASGLRLARIWNYVPAINACPGGGIENYQAFCRGRSLAFERHLGAGFKTQVPAASAVGSKGGQLVVVFAACRAPLRHVENPLQVPAYDYPAEFGPRSPSFARATLVAPAGGGAATAVFISGTAAIRGHATMAPGDTRRQLDFTLENLRELSAACALGPLFERGTGAAAGVTRHFKVYIRHAAEQAWIAAALRERLLRDGDVVSYLEADICRAPLNVEIEATLVRGAAVTA